MSMVERMMEGVSELADMPGKGSTSHRMMVTWECGG